MTYYQSDAKCIRAGEYINACRTLQHKPLSTTEGQRVALMNVGYFTEIRGDSINSGHRWSKKRKLLTCIGTSKKNCPCDLMMGYASADFTDGTARTFIIRHSCHCYHLNPASVILIWAQLHSCMFHILEWLLINACNNEDHAKIWTRPHLDTLYFAHDAYRVSASQF